MSFIILQEYGYDVSKFDVNNINISIRCVLGLIWKELVAVYIRNYVVSKSIHLISQT